MSARRCSGAAPALALLLAASGTIAPARAANPPPAGTAIEISRFAYSPQELSVAPGTTVVWTNRDDTPHTITSADHRLASPGLDTGDQFSFTFKTVGDYPYACALHPFMTGVVHVRAP